MILTCGKSSNTRDISKLLTAVSQFRSAPPCNFSGTNRSIKHEWLESGVSRVNQGYLRRHKTAGDDTVSDGETFRAFRSQPRQLSEAKPSLSRRPRHFLTQRDDENFWKKRLQSRKRCMLGNCIANRKGCYNQSCLIMNSVCT